MDEQIQQEIHPPATVEADDRSSTISYNLTNDQDAKPKADTVHQQVHTDIPDTFAILTVTYTDYTDDPTPFLTAGGDKALPRYSGRKNEDINAFFYKLRIFLNHPSINNYHKHKTTTSFNYNESKHLSTLLSLCLLGEALHPFLDNSRFDNKGIEMYHHLRQEC